MTQLFEPNELPTAREYLDVEGVARSFFGGKKEGTVRKYFRDKVLHVHQLGGKTGRTQLTEVNSAKVRIAVCEYLRRGGLKIGDAGRFIAEACGDDDVVVQAFIDDKRPLDEIYEAIKLEIARNRGR